MTGPLFFNRQIHGRIGAMVRFYVLCVITQHILPFWAPSPSLPQISEIKGQILVKTQSSCMGSAGFFFVGGKCDYSFADLKAVQELKSIHFDTLMFGRTERAGMMCFGSDPSWQEDMKTLKRTDTITVFCVKGYSPSQILIEGWEKNLFFFYSIFFIIVYSVFLFIHKNGPPFKLNLTPKI